MGLESSLSALMACFIFISIIFSFFLFTICNTLLTVCLKKQYKMGSGVQ